MAAGYCSLTVLFSLSWNKNFCQVQKQELMLDQNQVRQFINTVLDLHRDNFIELLNNAEFQENEVGKKELAVNYMTLLFKKELEENFNSFIKTNVN